MNNIPLITIVAGVVVFAASQYVLKLILEPIVELKKTITSISSNLLYYQAAITNATPNADVSSLLKRLSADLRSHASLIPFFRFLYFLHIFRIPKQSNILTACRELNGISYGMDERAQSADGKGDVAMKNKRAMAEISELLNVKTTYEH